MASSKRPAVDVDALHRQAQVAALADLVTGASIEAMTAAIGPTHVPGRFTPDVALLELAVDALALAVPDLSEPLEFEGLRQRYLPETSFSGKTQLRSIDYALHAPAIIRGGIRPDLLNDAGWWHTPLWIYATYALVIYARAAADRQGTTPAAIAQQIADTRALDLQADDRRPTR